MLADFENLLCLFKFSAWFIFDKLCFTYSRRSHSGMRSILRCGFEKAPASEDAHSATKLFTVKV